MHSLESWPNGLMRVLSNDGADATGGVGGAGVYGPAKEEWGLLGLPAMA